MGCSTCAVSKDGTPTGCGNKGHCSSGSCNKMNTYDWLTTLELNDPNDYHIVEVSFKKGARKGFYMNAGHTRAMTGDMVVLEAATGYDVGRITLSGDLVRAQMKKKKTPEERVIHSVVRKANERDLGKLQDARDKEKPAMIKARQIARTLGLEMKIGEVEYQGDLRKATFYYIADGRVDFRELVRMYAKEFRVKIEMRQIGSRQESGLVGGVGACGRELCCSTWLSDFSTVTTSAARYQNIAINQTKLSGQCGRLKCCLNYELDTYMDALKHFPKGVDYIKTKRGKAALIKTDIFKGLMFYAYIEEKTRGPIVPLDKERVKEIQKMNKAGELPDELVDRVALAALEETQEKEIEFADVTGEIELPSIKKKRNNRKKRSNNKRKSNQNRKKSTGENKQGNDNSGGQSKSDKSQPKRDNKDTKPTNKRRPNKRRPNKNKRNNQGEPKKDAPKPNSNNNKD